MCKYTAFLWQSKTWLRAQITNSAGCVFDSISHFLVTLRQLLYLSESQPPPLQYETNNAALQVCEVQ